MARTRSVRVATATVCLLLLLLAAAAAATTTEEANAQISRDMLEADGGSPVALSKEEPPSGHLSFRIVKGAIEKITGKSARLDLEKHDERERPLLSIP